MITVLVVIAVIAVWVAYLWFTRKSPLDAASTYVKNRKFSSFRHPWEDL